MSTASEQQNDKDKARGVAEYKNVNLGSASKEELVAMLLETATRAQYRRRSPSALVRATRGGAPAPRA